MSDKIQSLNWAANINPQNGFLSFPVEVRNLVYSYLFTSTHINNPRKDGKKFRESRLDTTKSSESAIKVYNTLSSLSRQTYVDVVGGGLLYQHAKFTFSTPDAMKRYLDVINPAHRDVLRNINVDIRLTNDATPLPPSLLPTLSSLLSLTHLKLTFRLGYSVAVTRYYLPNPNSHWPNLGYVQGVDDGVVVRLAMATWGDLIPLELESFEVSFEAIEKDWKSWKELFDDKKGLVPHFVRGVKDVVLRRNVDAGQNGEQVEDKSGAVVA